MKLNTKCEAELSSENTLSQFVCIINTAEVINRAIIHKAGKQVQQRTLS